MKEKFSWYLDSSPQEAEKNWSKAILTVDTNVLLDLYRYHNATRDKILSAIESFFPRVWISNQACEEFFSNRKKVIMDSEKIFKDASSKLSEIQTNSINEITQLKGFRLIPKTIIDDFEKQISSLFKITQGKIVEIKGSYPKYMIEDPIISRISNIFDQKVGNAFQETEKRVLIEEGKRRFENKIPPGFKDDNKPDERGYGDFLLWSEVINYARDMSSPIILITSEQKEDWWEQKSGKTLGPVRA
ncbi:PIN-like domain-containing protein [Komagataeibacter europaeus]|uniref:PIN-like domain-containing protein n=1 Tax=Komagataeibacter europaeus TaxID=33995 RepID=UPI0012DBFE4F|nr:PIN-like domain-containing protein [Komagataeibacter europaeus]